MMETQVLEKPVVRRLEQLAEFYRQEQASELMERTLDKLLNYEAETCRKQLRQLHEDLSEYEHQYGMTSAEFYTRFQSGQTDDRIDYVEWASLFQMAQRLEKRIALLEQEEYV